MEKFLKSVFQSSSFHFLRRQWLNISLALLSGLIIYWEIPNFRAESDKIDGKRYLTTLRDLEVGHRLNLEDLGIISKELGEQQGLFTDQDLESVRGRWLLHNVQKGHILAQQDLVAAPTVGLRGLWIPPGKIAIPIPLKKGSLWPEGGEWIEIAGSRLGSSPFDRALVLNAKYSHENPEVVLAFSQEQLAHFSSDIESGTMQIRGLLSQRTDRSRKQKTTPIRVQSEIE